MVVVALKYRLKMGRPQLYGEYRNLFKVHRPPVR